MSQRWRGVLASLLNPELRTALAELEPHSTLTDVRRARALERTRSGSESALVTPPPG